MAGNAAMELTLGPVLFDWKRQDLLRFYEEAADMAVDRVYVGEVVCVKKSGLSPDDMALVAERLERSGKKVTFASLAVVSNEEELDAVRRLSRLPGSIEANDVSALNIADPSRNEVFAGPHITAYNAEAVEFLKGIGVARLTLPVELPRETVAHIIRAAGARGERGAGAGVGIEVFAHGKVPLAFSWRCYTSRAYGLTKTDCRRHCALHPEGMELRTLEGDGIFTVNGTSVLSGRVYSLVEYVEDLAAIGVAALRISPQHRGTARVVDIFRRRMDGVTGPEEALLELNSMGGPYCNGWYLGKAGKDYIERAGAPVSGPPLVRA